LPVNENYLTLNLEAQKIATKSPFKIFQKLTAARKTYAIKSGSFEQMVISEHVYAFVRELPGSLSYLIVVNTGYENTQVDVLQTFPQLPQSGQVYSATMESILSVG
jgi:hypothetical protein